MELFAPVTALKGVGNALKSKLEKLDIVTVYDLLTYYPRGYEEDTAIVSSLDCGKYAAGGAPVTLELKIVDGPAQRFVKGYRIVTCTGRDSGGAVAVQWFNQPYIMRTINRGSTCILRGSVKARGASFYLSNPKLISRQQYEQMKGSLLPLYALTKGLTAETLRKFIRLALSEVSIPADHVAADPFLEGKDIEDFETALYDIHFPKDRESVIRARRRLVFDEFLLFMLNVKMMQSRGRDENVCPIFKSERVEQLLGKLPYELTGAQKRTLSEIYSDMGGKYMMNRLLQGDVGSGKTIVAFAAMLTAALSGFQSAVMAPTEVLARQHFEQLSALIREHGFEDLNCVLLTGSLTAKEKRRIRESIADGSALLAVGTHALIQDGVEFKNLGLVVTDEQHRFGVKQRQRLGLSSPKALREGEDGETEDMRSVHTLVMSATPIPRTLAMIIYGDLDISLMDELPAKRLPIKNCVVGPAFRNKAYEFIEKQVQQGRQALVICPMVEESEGMDGENVIDYTEKLRHSLPGDINIQYLHGKMKPGEKNDVMERFASGEIQVLVSTTVVEVGINVPNTTVMMVENAEHFGLAQLHQLRGRVGRGEHQSYCIFMCTTDGREAKERLDILNKSNDGFEIAREDLKQRGPGDMFGFRQSGDMAFKLGDIYSDSEVLKLAAQYAAKLTADLDEGRKSPVFEILDQKKLYTSVNL